MAVGPTGDLTQTHRCMYLRGLTEGMQHAEARDANWDIWEQTDKSRKPDQARVKEATVRCWPMLKNAVATGGILISAAI